MGDIAFYGAVLVVSVGLLVAWWRSWNARVLIVSGLLVGWAAWSLSTKGVDTDEPPWWSPALLDVLALVSVGAAVSTVVWLVRRSVRSRR